MLNKFFHDGFVANWIWCRHERLGNEIVFYRTDLHPTKNVFVLNPTKNLFFFTELSCLAVA